MSYYESVFLARQDISSSKVDSLVEGFTKTIQENGGTVASTELWGLRSLAYRIKKNRKAHYVLLNIDAPSPAVFEMERQMRLNEDVLRHLTLKVETLSEGPSKILQSRSYRDDRPRRSDDGPRHSVKPKDGDAPKADAPKTDAPKTDAPKTDAPKADAPEATAPQPATEDAPKTGGKE